jgi:thiamine biosynthesis protein ThiS
MSGSDTFSRMLVTVNGKTMDVPQNCTIQSLLDQVQVKAERVAVERNQDIVPRRSYGDCQLADGDQIEIVTFVGGG